MILKLSAIIPLLLMVFIASQIKLPFILCVLLGAISASTGIWLFCYLEEAQKTGFYVPTSRRP